MSEFEGILFTLKKRKQYPNESDREYYDFITFGYYDGLSVSCIDRWYQFRPTGIAESCGYVNLGEPFTDIYVIKGFFPADKGSDNELFDYEIWKKIGKRNPEQQDSKNDICEDANNMLKNSPYICVSSLHLSQTFVNCCDGLEEMTSKIKQKIKIIADEMECDLRVLHCAVFPIIGFSDYVIVFASDDFETPTYLISKLREWKVQSTDKAVISDCYTICGVYKDFKITRKYFREKSNVRLIAEFNLKEGVPAKEFHDALEKEIINELEKLQIEEDLKRKVESEFQNYYITFGNIDTLIMPDVNIESYLCLFMSQNFQPGGEFYKRYIIGTKTSICVAGGKNDGYGDKSEKNEPRKEMAYPIHKEWQEFSSDFERALKKNKYAVRMSRAIEQIIQNYYNIANTLHGFDIRSCLDEFISATLEDIRICFENENIDWKEINGAVKVFRDRVGDFVADLLRSDKPFIEGNTLSHPAIGTATKILFAYTAILNKLAKQLSDDDQEIVFLVISGGADATTAIDLFAFLRKDKIKKKFRKPVLIVVPEKGLYDIKGTIFRMLHEFMHFCGNRLRKDRYDLYLDIMGDIMAHDIVEPFFGEGFVEEYLLSEKKYLTQEKYESILALVKDSVKDQCVKIKQEIKNCICKYQDFIDYSDQNNDEISYYEYVLFQPYSGQDRRAGILSEDTIADIWNRRENSLCEKIKEILNAGEEKLYGNINTMLKKEEINAFSADIRVKRLAYAKQRNEDKRIEMYLNIYGSFLVDNYGVGRFKSNFCWYNYDEISKLGFRAMREGRSDFLAIRLLDMQVEGYLLSFIYEEKDINRAMPETIDNVLRLGSVLKVAYNISERNIEEDIRQKILESAIQMKTYGGYEYEDIRDRMTDYLDGYVERVKELLKEYEHERWKAVTEDVEKYLKNVSEALEKDRNINRNSYIKELKNIYRECDMTSKDGFHKTMKYLFRQWELLAGGDTNETAGCDNK